MKKIFLVEENEKNRILEMHRTAVKQSLVSEQADQLTTLRKQRIDSLLKTNPKYGFIEKEKMFNREQSLDVHLKSVEVITSKGLQTVRITGTLEEGTDNPKYIGQMIFEFDCQKNTFKLLNKPQVNPSYSGVEDTETNTPIKGSEKVSKMRKTDVGDEYYSNDIAKWFKNNLFICGKKYQTTVQ